MLSLSGLAIDDRRNYRAESMLIWSLEGFVEGQDPLLRAKRSVPATVLYDCDERSR